MAPTPRKEAAAAAQAAVPTKGSINRQYGQSISDVEGFTTALAHLLQQGPSAQGAYQSAIQGQQGIDAAAQHALGATGTPYAAGSQAAAAGLGTSALSALNARGAAAGAYGATLPHVAAARGTLGVQSLETARNQALQQRSESYSQAFQQALQQARQNAEAMREFNVNTGLQKRQMSIQQRQFAAGQAYQYAALAQNQSQFKASQAQQYNEWLLNQRREIQSAMQGGTGGLTPGEVATAAKAADSYLNNAKTGAVNGGTTIQQAIQHLVTLQVPRPLAVALASQAYANLTKPAKGQFYQYDKNGNHVWTAQSRDNFKAATGAYLTALKSWKRFMLMNNPTRRSTMKNLKSQGNAPGQGRGIG